MQLGMLIRLEVQISDQKNTVRYRPMKSFCDEAACMDHILRSRFPGIEINKLTVLTVFYCELKHVITVSFLTLVNSQTFFFFYFLTALNAEQT